MSEPDWNFEAEPTREQVSETSFNLAAYFDAMPDAKLATYDPAMNDDDVMAWDGNFTSDGDLLIPCCETDDVDVAMYRRVIAHCIEYRDRVRGSI